jgi:hypothetical protein
MLLYGRTTKRCFKNLRVQQRGQKRFEVGGKKDGEIFQFIHSMTIYCRSKHALTIGLRSIVPSSIQASSTCHHHHLICTFFLLWTAMVLVEHLISPATLPKIPAAPPFIEQLSVLSYNVLLPNSSDGWWTYKMYMPPLPKELQYQSSWDYRQDLMKKRIQLIDADVVCLQEVSPDSFPTDFEFMSELGYDGVEMFKKGRFRPATFWKTSKCELALSAGHKDRCLLTAFRSSQQSFDATQHNWFVCNCHLQAGKQGPRRVRQINEAVKGAMAMARKLKGKGVF